MASQYENLVWVEDENGRRYVCELTDKEREGTDHHYEHLTDEEKRHCSLDKEFPFN